MLPFHCFTFFYYLKLQLILQINLPDDQNIIFFQNCSHALPILYSIQLLAQWAAHSRYNEYFLIFLVAQLLIPYKGDALLLDVVLQMSWKPRMPNGILIRWKLEDVGIFKTLVGEELSERIPQSTLDHVTCQASKISGIICYYNIAKSILTTD